VIMLTIGEVARQAGIRASAIRYYESIQLLPPAQRSSGRRLYGPEIFERLAFIQTARQLSFSLHEIQRLFDDQTEKLPLSERWQLLANQKLGEVKSLIKQAKTIELLLERGLDCTCSDLSDCIDCVLANCQGQ
jgi:MerR family transcriptional regulator, redox-sensitive transcriptional activator SoxR